MCSIGLGSLFTGIKFLSQDFQFSSHFEVFILAESITCFNVLLIDNDGDLIKNRG